MTNCLISAGGRPRTWAEGGVRGRWGLTDRKYMCMYWRCVCLCVSIRVTQVQCVCLWLREKDGECKKETKYRQRKWVSPSCKIYCTGAEDSLFLRLLFSLIRPWPQFFQWGQVSHCGALESASPASLSHDNEAGPTDAACSHHAAPVRPHTCFWGR